LDNQDPELKAARQVVRGVWQENFHNASLDGNLMRSYNQTQRLLIVPEGYNWLHNVLFDTLKNKQDPDVSDPNNVYSNRFFQGLYQKLTEQGITFERLKNNLIDYEPNSEDPKPKV
jgi:hypothetical protein